MVSRWNNFVSPLLSIVGLTVVFLHPPSADYQSTIMKCPNFLKLWPKTLLNFQGLEKSTSVFPVLEKTIRPVWVMEFWWEADFLTMYRDCDLDKHISDSNTHTQGERQRSFLWWLDGRIFVGGARFLGDLIQSWLPSCQAYRGWNLEAQTLLTWQQPPR